MTGALQILLLSLGLWMWQPTDAAAEDAAEPLSATRPQWTREEVFRRAFWRHPAPGDRILHAERREPATGASDEPATWQWFLAVKPSAELLAALRDPATFGLWPTANIRAWSTEPAAPDWFPASASFATFEILQTPAGNLTVLYRERDNVLFATDGGSGFASARSAEGSGQPSAP